VYGVNSISAPSINTWYAVAVSRVGADLMLFVDGVLQATTNIGTASINDTSYYTYIGANVNGGTLFGHWHGYLDELRITKGVGRYTTNYTVDTEAFPNS